MQILFQHKGAFNVLKIIRKDESYSWTKLNQIGVIHDLCHYVIEKNLKFTDAFFGLINQGYEIQDFEKPREERASELIPANLPLQAIQTEYMAGLLQMAVFDPNIKNDYFQILKTNMESKNVDFPESLNEELVALILVEIEDLIKSWKLINKGQELILNL